jgi:hypothetical protein
VKGDKEKTSGVRIHNMSDGDKSEKENAVSVWEGELPF